MLKLSVKSYSVCLRSPEWKCLRGLMIKSEEQELNMAQWSAYGKLIEKCATVFVKEAAHTTVYTIAQLTNEWSKEIKFDWIIVNEATKINDAQFVQI